MQNPVYQKIDQCSKRSQRKRIWKKFVSILGCFVVFCTAYALILPALTLERSAVCELPEHTHTDTCYQTSLSGPAQCSYDTLDVHSHSELCYGADSQLLCGYADYLAHTHTDSCLDENGTLTCPIPEVLLHTHTPEGCYQSEEDVHRHDESCYAQSLGELTCTLETTHTHTPDCQTAVLECQLTVQAHEHLESCYESKLTCTLEESETSYTTEQVEEIQLICTDQDPNHIHDEELCYQTTILTRDVEIPGHIHGDDCYTTTLLCTKTEDPHEHTETCYRTEITCTLSDTQVHTHTDSCYAVLQTLTCPLTDQAELTCQLPEIKLHTHGDACFETVTAEDGTEHRSLICPETEVREHIHDNGCFLSQSILVCTETEHTHTAECTPLLGLPEEERSRVESVIGLLDLLPAYEEIETALDGFYEADDTDGEEAYLTELYIQVDAAYQAYADLGEELQFYVTNPERLMDLEFIWSRVTLEETPQVSITSGNGSVFVPITGVNYYSVDSYYANIATVIDGDKAINMGFPAGADYRYHTAYVIEKLDNPTSEYEYFVDAVISGDFTKDTLAPKTEGGFVLYILNGTMGSNVISRGDLVDPDFWYGNHLGAYSAAGFGTMKFTGSSTAISYADPVSLNATVKLFDYDDNINNYDFGWGYTYRTYHSFKTGDYGYDHWFANQILADVANGTTSVVATSPGADELSYNNLLINYSTETDGYFFHGGGFVGKNTIEDHLGVNDYPVFYANKELDELFGGFTTLLDGTPTLQGVMKDGGGLFQMDDKGYYYYDSAKNAAYYDKENNRFLLYDNLIMRPWYDAYNATDEAYGNFYPFDRLTSTNITTDQFLLDAGLATTNAALAHNQIPRPSLAGTVARLEDKVNVSFGMTVEFDFYMPKDGLINGEPMTFDFHGDDDVYVYVDDVLVLNIGGLHGAMTGTIDFSTGIATFPINADNKTSDTLANIFSAAGITDVAMDGDTFADYTKHNIKFFYMERGGNLSYCRLRFNMPILEDESLLISKELTSNGNDDVVDYLENTLAYEYRVVKADANGDPTDELFVSPGTTYKILEHGALTGETGTVDSGGRIRIKPGQTAMISNMLVLGEGATHYIVEEIVPDDLVGQYASVEYAVSGAAGTIEPEDGPSEEFSAYRTESLSAETSQMIIYRNKVDINNLSMLKLTKLAAPNATFPSGSKFQFQVTLGGTLNADGTLTGGALIPDGTEYTVGSTTYTTTDGIVELEIGQTATITKGILSGTAYYVTELGTGGDTFLPTYSVTATPKGTSYVTESFASGVFPLNSATHITVTNADYAFSVDIPITKQAMGVFENAKFDFKVQQVKQSGISQWTAVSDPLPGLRLNIPSCEFAETVSGTLTVGFPAGTADGDYYFRISEAEGTDDFAYDQHFYIAKVTVEDSQATFVHALKDGLTDQTPTNRIWFFNYQLTDLTVTKTVEGITVDEDLVFDFAATIQPHVNASFTIPEGDGYTVSGDTIHFQLGHGDSLTIPIPLYSTVTVTETNYPGFQPSYRLNSASQLTSGDAVTKSNISNAVSIHFVNSSSYSLPDTGGFGAGSHTIAGLLLMMLCAAYGLYRVKWRKRRSRAQ